jgi:16S rRNA (cytosine967-C5)-methyltransferase
VKIQIPAQQQVPLWQQIQATAKVIHQVRSGTSGSVAIESVSSSLRPGVQALAFEVWRNLGRAQALRNMLASRLPPPAVDAILCVTLALAWRDTGISYEPFTLVNQAVEAAKRQPATAKQAGFLNACLRQFLRERAALVLATDSDPVARWNFPAWWIRRMQREQPDHWQEILQVTDRQAPMTLRLNLRKTTMADYLCELERADVSGSSGGPSVVYLDHAASVRSVPGFQAGVVSVQDAAAQLAAPLLLDGLPGNPGLRILDACAAPGGKTGHLLELASCEVTALDIDGSRCARITENLTRLALSAKVIAADAARPQDWWDGQLFDRILLDAPCTASGIVRRHPDIRWLRREADVAKLALLQHQMLRTLWPLLRPGGRLLYCTCSIFSAEGTGQVETFLAHNTDAVLLKSPGQLMPKNGIKMGDVSDNQMRDHDGFFFALFQKHVA